MKSSLFTSLLLGLLNRAGADQKPVPMKSPEPFGQWWIGYHHLAVPNGFKMTRPKLFPGQDLTMPVLQTDGFQHASEVERVVILIHGKHRDCWEIAQVQNAEDLAVYYGMIPGKTTLLVAPCFINKIDLDHGVGYPETDIVWGLTTWASGHKNQGPKRAGDIGSYDVMDQLVEKYLDRSVYPNVDRVVVGGHSLGGQAVQRYCALAKDKSDESRFHCWVANPGSMLWLDDDRPLPQYKKDCDYYDEFKYGLRTGKMPSYDLGNVIDMGRDGIVDRYRKRNIHHLWGMADFGPGDTRCEAKTQGLSHLERGMNFDKMLRGIDGGTNNTVDYVPFADHDGSHMYRSNEGLNKFFQWKPTDTQSAFQTNLREKVHKIADELHDLHKDKFYDYKPCEIKGDCWKDEDKDGVNDNEIKHHFPQPDKNKDTGSSKADDKTSSSDSGSTDNKDAERGSNNSPSKSDGKASGGTSSNDDSKSKSPDSGDSEKTGDSKSAAKTDPKPDHKSDDKGKDEDASDNSDSNDNSNNNSKPDYNGNPGPAQPWNDGNYNYNNGEPSEPSTYPDGNPLPWIKAQGYGNQKSEDGNSYDFKFPNLRNGNAENWFKEHPIQVAKWMKANPGPGQEWLKEHPEIGQTIKELTNLRLPDEKDWTVTSGQRWSADVDT